MGGNRVPVLPSFTALSNRVLPSVGLASNIYGLILGRLRRCAGNFAFSQSICLGCNAEIFYSAVKFWLLSQLASFEASIGKISAA